MNFRKYFTIQEDYLYINKDGAAKKRIYDFTLQQKIGHLHLSGFKEQQKVFRAMLHTYGDDNWYFTPEFLSLVYWEIYKQDLEEANV